MREHVKLPERPAKPANLVYKCVLAGAVFIAIILIVWNFRIDRHYHPDESWPLQLAMHTLASGICGSAAGLVFGLIVGYFVDLVRYQRWRRGRVLRWRHYRSTKNPG